jgi:hypothetical protein
MVIWRLAREGFMSTNIGSRLVRALAVRDMGETLHFYRPLGFRVTGCHPDEPDPHWAEVHEISDFHVEF